MCVWVCILFIFLLFPPLEYLFQKGEGFVCLQLYPYSLDECLACSWYMITIYQMNTEMQGRLDQTVQVLLLGGSDLDFICTQ